MSIISNVGTSTEPAPLRSPPSYDSTVRPNSRSMPLANPDPSHGLLNADRRTHDNVSSFVRTHDRILCPITGCPPRFPTAYPHRAQQTIALLIHIVTWSSQIRLQLSTRCVSTNSPVLLAIWRSHLVDIGMRKVWFTVQMVTDNGPLGCVIASKI